MEPKRPSRRRPEVPAPTVEIRELELADLQPVYQLGLRLFTAERWPTLYRAWDQYEITDRFGSDGEFCLVAESGNQVIGFALGTVMEKPRSAWRYGWLLWLGVEPGFKRRGIASRLVNRLTELFIEHDVRMMLVDTDAENHDAIRFFHRQGFGGELGHVYLSRNLDDHPLAQERRRPAAGS